MSRPPVRFTLHDADGVEHAYEVILHPATEGARIMWQLVAMGVEPVGKLAAGLLASDGLSATSIRTLLNDPAGLERLRTGLDLTGLAASVRTSLASVQMGALTKDILSRTSRDGRDLANQLLFDEAYSGNYGELALALWKVVQANRFLPGLPT